MHGVLNKLCCALYSGATVEFFKFHPKALWERFAAKQDITLFMAVPTIYAKVKFH